MNAGRPLMPSLRHVRTLAIVLPALAMALAVPAVHAGRHCEAKPPTVAGVRQAMALAERTAAALDASGARVAVLARVGQDLGAWGLDYSHLGFAYREPGVAGGRPAWRVVHKLNECGTAHAAVWRQGLGDFFLDNPFEYRSGIVVPAPQVQERLLAVLRSNALATRLDTPAYSMLAYPWALAYQQSNQWALETLAMAQEPAAVTRERAQAWLKLRGYEPTVLHIPAHRRLGARVLAANIAFDDHPNEKRFSGRIETVTVDSVFAWLGRSGLGSAVQAVR